MAASVDHTTHAYREATIRRSVEENSMFCHTGDKIAWQKLTPAQWKAELDKIVT